MGIEESIRRILREELNEFNFLYTLKDSIGRLLLRDKYNFKPSLSFDKKFGTEISQKYDYPFGLSENKIWRIIDSCYEGSEKYCVLVKKIVDNLGDYFPYPDYNNLPFEKKVDILQGMVSNFNYDDIISFSVEEKKGENNELKDEVNELQNKLNYTIQWVPSKQTLRKIKKHMNLQESITKLLKEETSIQKNLLNSIEKIGFIKTSKMVGGLERLFNIIGKEHLNKHNKIRIIKEIIGLNNEKYITLSELNEEPILVDDNDEEFSQIEILFPIGAELYYYDKNTGRDMGEVYRVYDDLKNYIVDDIFSMVIGYYYLENN